MDSSSPVPIEPYLFLTGILPDFFGDHLLFTIVNLFLFVLIVLVAGVISSSETSFFSLTHAERKELGKNQNKRNQAILDFLDEPKSLLITLLLSHLLLYIALIATGIKLFELMASLGWVQAPKWLVAILLGTVMMFVRLVFGDIAPKVYAVQNNVKIARKSIWFIKILHILLRPLVQLFLMCTSWLDVKLEKYNKPLLAFELDQALDHVSQQSSTQQTIEERSLLKGIVKFGNIYVTQIMKSRIDVVSLDTSLNFHDLLDKVRDSGYSRIPVCNGDLDHTIGIIYAKDLLFHLNESEDFDWKPLIKPAMFVPESKKIDSLLEEFQSKRVHMAIVVDEYGGASGLVTLEDVLEEVIGEIKDEFDDIHEIDYRKIDAQNYVFEGKTGVNDVCKVIGLPVDTFDELSGEADTIAGMLLEIKGELPDQGDEIETNGFTFKVLEMNSTRIVKVKVTIHEV